MDSARSEPAGASPTSGVRGSRGEIVFATATAVAALVYHPAAPAAASKQVALLLVGLVGMAFALSRLLGRGGRRRWHLSLPVTAWLGLCLWYGLSRLWASHASGSILATWLGGAALALTASALEPQSVRHVARRCAALIGAGAAAVCFLQALGGARGIALHGGQGNPNWLGLVLACALPLELELAVHARQAGRLTRLLPAAAVVLSIGALLLSASRVAWVAVIVTGLVLLAGKWRWVPAAGAAALAAFWLASSNPLEAWQGRWWIWRVSARAAQQGLPWGTGLGDFAAAFLDAQGELLWRLDAHSAAMQFTNATTAHNDWLETCVTGGPVAVGLLAAAVGLAIAQLRRSWPAGAGCVLALAICALGDSPLHQPAAVALFVLVGAATPRQRLYRLFMLGHAAVLAGVILVLPQAVSQWLGHHALSRARVAGVAERLRLLDQASRIDRCSGQAALQLGLAHLEQGDSARALGHLERSRRLLANLGTDVAIGNALLGLSQPARAVAAYRRALGWHPGYFRAHANLVEALRQLGRLDEAERHLGIARQLQPGHPKLGRIAERLRRTRIETDSQ